MTAEQVEEVERIVNREILANTPVTPYHTEQKKALADGVTALFGEKYGDVVRVVKIAEYSSELCGGTHVASTGEIGQFRITTETGVAAGVRRIEAITGEAAYEKARAEEAAVRHLAELLKTSPDKVVDRVESSLEEIRTLRNDLTHSRKKLAAGAGQAIQYESIADLNMKFLFHRLTDGSADEAVALADHAKKQDEAVVAVVASPSGNLVVTASTAATKRGAHAGKLLGAVAGRMGGRGGGRPDFAQGKVPNLDAWDSAKDGFLGELRAMIGK
jgi:alanyl-tRNA synthetase